MGSASAIELCSPWLNSLRQIFNFLYMFQPLRLDIKMLVHLLVETVTNFYLISNVLPREGLSAEGAEVAPDFAVGVASEAVRSETMGAGLWS